MVDYKETLDLIKKAQDGDDEAKNILINENYPLVKSVIRRYKNKGLDYEDLFQLGCVGFVKAINNFDDSFGVRFSTYAVPMIAGEVKRFLRDDGYIKVSRAIKAQAVEINRYISSLPPQASQPDIATIAKDLGMTAEEVVFAMDSVRYPMSLSTPVDSSDEGSITLEERLSDSEDEEKRMDHFILKELIKNLCPRDRKIIIMRYYRDKTQAEIAKELGVSQVQVSRIENKILASFKNKLR